MSSLGIFNKETKTYQKVAGTAEVAVVDKEMSDTSVNPVQNKVIKKYVDSKQVEVPIAGTGKAGIVKPADGLTVEEDGTLKVKLDGTTLTMDQVNNVIKLADALKDKIGTALQPESIVNNQTTTEEGFTLDARQANPNLDGTLAKKVANLNGSLNQQGLLSAISFGHSGEVFDYLNDNQHVNNVFFTNWVDNENFPKIYGNGLIMTGLDSNDKFIVYATTEPNLYFAHYNLATDKNVINWHKCTYN